MQQAMGGVKCGDVASRLMHVTMMSVVKSLGLFKPGFNFIL